MVFERYASAPFSPPPVSSCLVSTDNDDRYKARKAAAKNIQMSREELLKAHEDLRNGKLFAPPAYDSIVNTQSKIEEQNRSAARTHVTQHERAGGLVANDGVVG
jgi:hypothetical protein